MSEKHDGNTGWQTNEEGDVIPPEVEPAISPRQPHINRAEMLRDPEFDARQVAEDVDPTKGITREQARRLNQAAKDQRGGTELGVDPSSPNSEVPGKHGRSNWQTD